MKIDDLIKELTLDEKIGMIHGDGLFQTKGVERLGIPPLKMADGPMGVRKDFKNDRWEDIGQSYDFVTYHPCNAAVAATWNPNMARDLGDSLGQEARGRKKDVILAPGINIVRSPFGGRNFEYLSEDPYLTQQMVVPMIQGIQQHDVAACVKHFALNNQETDRLEVEVDVSDQALWEIYLPGFYSAIKEGNVHSLMGAYNKYKGEYCCQSHRLLNGLLRETWQYDGMLVSDWGGVHQTYETAYSALDLEMNVTSNFDEYYLANPLKEAILAGRIEESVVDEKVYHLLTLMDRLKMLSTQERVQRTYNTLDSQEKILKIAEESIVLLKNDENLLPIQKTEALSILVVGENAERIHSNGGGSSEIKALFEMTPLLGLHMAANDNVTFNYAKGYESLNQEIHEKNWQEKSTEADFKMTDSRDLVDNNTGKILRDEAVNLAKTADIVIFIGGLNHDHDSEGIDREDLNLPYQQNELIEALLEVNSQTVVSLVGGSAVAMPWIEKASTVLWTWYNGARGGQAFGEVVFGQVNPSGRLPMSFPKHIEDCSAHSIGEFPGSEVVKYSEGIYVGYRHHDVHQIEPLFSFGHGLSYTNFESSIKKVTVDESDELKVIVEIDIKNIGNVEGKETIQIYVGSNEQDVRYKQLKGFDKVMLKPLESQKVIIELDKYSFGRYENEKFNVKNGSYTLYLGSSSSKINDQNIINIKQNYSYQLV